MRTPLVSIATVLLFAGLFPACGSSDEGALGVSPSEVGGAGGTAGAGAAGGSPSSAGGPSSGGSGGAAGATSSLASLLAQGSPLPLPTARSIAFSPCTLFSDGTGPAAECGTFEVPLRPGEPGGRTITSFVKRYRSAETTTPTRQLFLLAGGPGASGLIYENLSASLVALDPTVEIYLPDHRGTGRSTRLGCEYEESDISASGHFLAPQEWADCVTTVEELWKGDQLAFTTTNAAYDLGILIESVRSPGAAPLVYGASYGTSWAHRYLQLFPTQSAGVILDAIAPPNAALDRQDVDADDAGRDLLAACALDTTCRAHLGDDPHARGLAIFASLDEGHCKKLTKKFGEPRMRLRQAFGQMMMNEGPRLLIPATLARVERCNDEDVKAVNQLLTTYFGAPAGPAGSLKDLMYRQWGFYLSSQIALSEMWTEPGPSAETLAAEREALLVSRDVTSGFEGPLATLPRYPRDAYAGRFVTTDTPMLMLQGTWDPATRPEPAYAVRDHYQGAHQRWIDIPHGAHGAAGYQQTLDGSSCGSTLLLQFVESPTTQVDTSCLADVKPPSFAGAPKMNTTLFGTEDAWGDP